jgi:hypothetical protein
MTQFLPSPLDRHNAITFLGQLSAHLETVGHMTEFCEKVVDVHEFLKNMPVVMPMLAVAYPAAPVAAVPVAAVPVAAVPVAAPEASVPVAERKRIHKKPRYSMFAENGDGGRVWFNALAGEGAAMETVPAVAVVELAPMTLVPPSAFVAAACSEKTVKCQCCNTPYPRGPGQMLEHRKSAACSIKDHSSCKHTLQNTLRTVRRSLGKCT